MAKTPLNPAITFGLRYERLEVGSFVWIVTDLREATGSIPERLVDIRDARLKRILASVIFRNSLGAMVTGGTVPKTAEHAIEALVGALDKLSAQNPDFEYQAQASPKLLREMGAEVFGETITQY